MIDYILGKITLIQTFFINIFTFLFSSIHFNNLNDCLQSLTLFVNLVVAAFSLFVIITKYRKLKKNK